MRVSINVMPFPTGAYSDRIYSFQPEGTQVSPPANVTYPNNTVLGDGASVDLYVPDFAENTFDLAGTGTVTTGATLIESDAPVISRFDWGFPAPPTGCLTDVVGRVVNASAVPIAGATVLAIGAGATSAADGTFAMPSMPCPGLLPGIVATAAVVTASGDVLTGQSDPAITVFNGVTDVGDIVVSAPICGNGFLNPPEECDDGNHFGGDECNPACLENRCGDGVLDPGEECDSSPGCTDLCTVCGDGILTFGEECDLGILNGQPDSICTTRCRTSICGNGVIEENEECDDGPANGGPFCDATCKIKPGRGEFAFSAVRALLGCGVDLAPNTTTTSGAPACEPPVFFSAFRFGPSGGGSFTASLAIDLSDAMIRMHLDDVQTAGDVDVSSAEGWELRAVVRLTLRDGPNAGTLIDLDVAGPATLLEPGVLEAGIAIAQATGVSFAPFALHDVAIVDVAVVDPAGERFAVRGHLIERTPSLAIDRPVAAVTSVLGLAPAYVSCGNFGGDTPSGAINGIPSCSPHQTFSEQGGNLPSGWRFGPDTLFSVRAQSSNADVLIQGKGEGIVDAFGPADGIGVLVLTVRATIRNGGSDKTVVDFPASSNFSVVGGKFALKTSLNAMVGFALPISAAQIEILEGEIVDSNGDTLARLGVSDSY
jgi:cysteine-rich repeat protein